jgi:hypothetical protein
MYAGNNVLGGNFCSSDCKAIDNVKFKPAKDGIRRKLELSGPADNTVKRSCIDCTPWPVAKRQQPNCNSVCRLRARKNGHLTTKKVHN